MLNNLAMPVTHSHLVAIRVIANNVYYRYRPRPNDTKRVLYC